MVMVVPIRQPAPAKALTVLVVAETGRTPGRVWLQVRMWLQVQVRVRV